MVRRINIDLLLLTMREIKKHIVNCRMNLLKKFAKQLPTGKTFALARSHANTMAVARNV